MIDYYLSYVEDATALVTSGRGGGSRDDAFNGVSKNGK